MGLLGRVDLPEDICLFIVTPRVFEEIYLSVFLFGGI